MSRALRALLPLGLLIAVAPAGVWSGCATEENPYDTDGGGGTEGSPCTKGGDCAVGFVCAGTGTCQRAGAAGTRGVGETCAKATDCLIDLVCASNGKCANPGTGQTGDECEGPEGCMKGLVCAYTGSSKGACAKKGDPGTKAPGEACTDPSDCMFGSLCVSKVCTALAYWAGATCTEDKGALRVYFEIPRTNKPLADFYRLPFPSDIRMKNGRVDVTGHPNPGTALPKEYGDIVGNFYKAIGEDVTGFGPSQGVFFRVSKTFDLSSIKLDFVNIDKTSSAYGGGVSYYMWTTTDRGKYICPNYIVVRPAVGRPLLSKTTYAVLLRKGIKDSTGTEAVQDADFKLVISDTEPTDSEEKAAWKAYAPLRAYLKDKSIASSDVLAAAVYTIMDVRARMSKFRQVITLSAQAPTSTDLVLCDGTKKSPCEDGKNTTHVCPTSPSTAFDEIQGTYQTPVFQKGTAPYKTVSDGGDIAYDSSGNPTIQRHEKACFALSVPKGATMPAAGWPVVIFAHGTGGSYRNFVDNGTAAALAHVKDSTGATVSQMAVIGIDGSMHGPRRGSTDSPDELFFNLRNPKAARDNTYQGAADKFQLVRFLQSLSLDATTSPTKTPIKFDTSKIYFFGHSQGTIEGLPFLAFEPNVKATVLSGAGGYLLGSLLAKTKPVNIAGIVQLALADGKVGTSHPLLNLLQMYFEEIDGMNYGKAIFTKPETGVGPKHTLLSFGIADSYTPPGTINALGWSMEIRQVKQSAQRCGDKVCNGTESCKTCATDCKACPAGTTCGNGTCEAKEDCGICPEDCKPCADLYALDDPPVKENVYSEGKKYTCSMIQYVSDGTYDDHFVLFKNPDGQKQSTHFLGSAARDGSPTILKVK